MTDQLPLVMLGPDSGQRISEHLKGVQDMSNEREPVSGLRIRTNGKIEKVEIRSLEDMQAVVGGLIQALPMDEDKHGFSIYLNEEGRVHEVPINMTASLWLLRHDVWPGLDEPLHGDILVLGPTGEDGETTPVPEDVQDTIPNFWVEPSFGFTVVE